MGPSGAPPKLVGQQKSGSKSQQTSSFSVKTTQPKKRAYELTKEELDAIVKEDVYQ